MNGTGNMEDISAETVPSKPIADHSVKDTWGYTYFVRRGDTIKIGHSAIPKQRIIQLQVSFPEPLEVLAIVPHTIINESSAHQKFAHLRISGEWFRAEPDLIQFISEAKASTGRMPKRKRTFRVVDPVVSKLLKLRSDHGFETAIGPPTLFNRHQPKGDRA